MKICKFISSYCILTFLIVYLSFCLIFSFLTLNINISIYQTKNLKNALHDFFFISFTNICIFIYLFIIYVYFLTDKSNSCLSTLHQNTKI